MTKIEKYVTTDTPLAAYLCLQGYTLLGAIDTGTGRNSLILTWPGPIEDMQADILKHIEEFNTNKKGYKDYYMNLKMCLRKAKNPIPESDLEANYWRRPNV